jgi:hypothetical protein
LVCSSRLPRRPRPWRPGSAGLTHRQPDRPTGVWARSPEAGRSTRRTIADPGSPIVALRRQWGHTPLMLGVFESEVSPGLAARSLPRRRRPRFGWPALLAASR